MDSAVGLVKVDLTTGQRTTFGFILLNNGSAVLDPDEDRLLMASPMTALDLSTETFSTISAAQNDPRFLGPLDIALDAPRRRAFVATSWNSRPAIVVVELGSGDRVTFYR